MLLVQQVFMCVAQSQTAAQLFGLMGNWNGDRLVPNVSESQRSRALPWRGWRESSRAVVRGKLWLWFCPDTGLWVLAFASNFASASCSPLRNFFRSWASLLEKWFSKGLCVLLGGLTERGQQPLLLQESQKRLKQPNQVLLLVLLSPQPLFCCADHCRRTDSYWEEIPPCLLGVGIATWRLFPFCLEEYGLAKEPSDDLIVPSLPVLFEISQLAACLSHYIFFLGFS